MRTSLSKPAVFALLGLGVLLFGQVNSEEAKPKVTRVNSKVFEGWDVEPFCGTSSSPLPPAFFRQGPRMESGGSGHLVVEKDGTTYVASGYFIYQISKEGRVSLLAGTPGVAGYKDGRADIALFGGIGVMRMDAKGILYAMEPSMRCIRTLSPGEKGKPWQVKTLVGSPNRKGARVDGPLESASIHHLRGMTLFDDGRIFIMDQDHFRVIQDGKLSTINTAGGRGYTDGPLKNARFKIAFTSNCLTSDGKNIFVISDMWNNVLRRIDLEKQIITTIAGGPARGSKGSGTPKGTDPFRDGPAMWARFHPGGGVTTAYMDRSTGNVYSIVADDRPHIYSPADKWVRTVKEGMPKAFDSQGRAYLGRGRSVVRLRKLKEGEKPFEREQAPKEEKPLFTRAAFKVQSIPKDVLRFTLTQPGTPPTLDGKLDDACWKKAKVHVLQRFNGEAADTQTQTKVQVLVDKENLYVAMHCTEPTMSKMKKASRARDDGRFYTDDYVECFIIPSLDPRDPAYQLMINNAEQTWDAKSKNAKAWNPKLEVKVGREANAWIVEFKIPLKEIPGAAKASSWRMNLSRYRDRGPSKNRESTWSLLYTSSSHAYSRFNVVTIEALNK